MMRIFSTLCLSVILTATSAQSEEKKKKKAEPQPKTIVDVVDDVLMAPVKLVEDLLNPAPAKPSKK